ncbi:MAG TPA: TonB-dependent receptor [Candidatus Eremiobacteraceae bacterium]|nr:TonB-dependent receptor [Candidatus Eremiobacteraceae bacterium]
MRTFVRAALFAVACVTVLSLAGLPALAQGSSSIAGVVYNASNGAAVANAKVTLNGAATPQSTTTDKNGSFSFGDLHPGTYFLRTTAALYEPAESAPIAIGASQTIDVSVALQPVTTTNITTLGHVTVTGQRTLNTSTVASTTISASAYTASGTSQVQDLLQTTPGVTIEQFDNGAPGNVTTLTIRGTGGFVGGTNTGYEVLVLQDGEPMRNGEYGDDDLSGLTPAIYSRIEVDKGVGGTSIFGANTIGGTVNLVTIDPRSSEGAEAEFGVGSWGLVNYNLQQTDTLGRFAYILDFHQYDVQGYIPSQLLVDVPPFTYSGSATTPPIGSITNPTENMLLRSGLGKIRYDFGSSSYGVLTFTDEADVRDQFGLLGDPESVFLGETETDYSNDPLGYPYWFGYPNNFVQNTDPKWSFDYHTLLGGGSLVLRYYTNWINRWVNGNGAPPLQCCYLQKSVDHLSGTEGIWEKAIGNNDLTLALGGNSDTFVYGECGEGGFNTCVGYADSDDGFPDDVPVTDADIVTTNGTQIEDTALVRDDYDASDKLKLTFAGYYSDYSDLNVKRFDPRFAVRYQPDSNSIVRFSVGTGFASPRLSDIVSPLITNPFLTVSGPNCPTSNQFCNATSGNPNIKGESALGYDLGYERAWGSVGDLSVDAYRTVLNNHIFDAIVPASPSLQEQGILGIEEPINVANSIYQGLEFGATIPFCNSFSARGYYNTQSAYPYDVAPSLENLIQNVVNDEQYMGVPLHKVGYSLNFQNGSRVTGFIGGDWYGQNNSYNVPQFWIYNAGLSAPYGANGTLHFTWRNIFNKNAFIYSNFDGGVPYSGYSGPYDTTAFSSAPHSIGVSLDERWGSLK